MNCLHKYLVIGPRGFQLPQAAPLKVAFDEFKIVSRGQK
jgi:hypothetical protein